ncbi:hypothetical protein [Actinomadura sp. WMMB 499]|uniref:hypothetical protein n=1 Tax=Actinomadura sp. WMMB 499 TaxID=1219491 RepID=UPI0012491EC7|nr:hypothetical protein [Actinomadura sp. WMMB 499]QFG24931.1 hypothetical protein F7P10_31140 [Actinomadura sp. WMMB 499]
MAPETIEGGGRVVSVVRHVFDSWPEFTFMVTADEFGIWTDARFVRTADDLPDLPAHPGVLVPWQVTLDEVSAHFGPLVPGDSWHPFHECGIPGPGGHYSATFCWGLLQTVPQADDAIS